MKPKRTYKDSMFRSVFNDKKRLQSLFKALTGRFVPLRDIRITTLRGTFFDDVKNDISFLVGNLFIVLLEHQSTPSPNMPIRMLWYIAKLYRQYVDMKLPYRNTLVPLPVPMFFVFYNGTDKMPEKWELRLSDAFGENLGTMELVVTVYNINYAKNRKILEKCQDLKFYSIFVASVRENVQSGMTLRQAIIEAIRYCRENDILEDYFAQIEQEEVIDMVSVKWDPELAKQVWMEEAHEAGFAAGLTEGKAAGRAEGRVEGRDEGRKQGLTQATLASIRNLTETLHLTVQQAMDALKIPPGEQEKYASQL